MPSEDYWENGPLQRLKNTLSNKFQFIEGFKTAFSVMGNTQGQTLNYEFEFMGKSYAIDFSWYEPHRLTIRSAIGMLFLAAGALSWLRNILRAIGVIVNNQTGDVPN